MYSEACKLTGRLCSLHDCSRGEETTAFHVPAECLGVGLVRAFNAAEGLLFILTPLPLSTLQRVKLLQVPALCHALIRSMRQHLPLPLW